MKLTKQELEIYKFASTDECRLAFNSVYIGNDKVIATDGHMMAVVKIENPNPLWEPVLVKAEWVKAIHKQLKKNDEIEFHQTQSGEIGAIGYQYLTTPIKGQYAPIIKGVDIMFDEHDDCDEIFTQFDSLKLAKAMAYAGKFTNSMASLSIKRTIAIRAGKLKVLLHGKRG